METNLKFVTQQEIATAKHHRDIFQRGETSGFMNTLFKTISIADTSNLKKLAQGFPAEVFVWCSYIWGQKKAIEFMAEMKMIADPEGLLEENK